MNRATAAKPQNFKTYGDLHSFTNPNQENQMALANVKEGKIYKYAIKFSIIMKVNHGEKISVIGSIKELGKWVDYKCHLDWHEGHYWMNQQPILTDSAHFQYKYVRYRHDHIVLWEKGINRIANLQMMT